ncbi:M4 family metallopeptidase [Micromonospora sp. NPDC000089]|uniref:M4 family metallopeptidase n=1 Tax=unclassified Micromonospora TaxID=2617518 RepID=UPI00369D4AA2
MKRPLAAVGAALLAGGMLTGVAATAQARPGATAAAPSPAARAATVLRDHPGLVQGAGGETYQPVRTKVDGDGAAHTRYRRSYHGLRVYGGDFVIHTAPGGDYAGASVGLAAPLTLGTTPRVSATTARSTARRAFTGRLTGVRAPELFVDASSGRGRLAWETVATGWKADRQTPSRLHVIVDAATGRVIGSYDEIESVAGTGTGVYSGTVPVDTTLAATTYQLIDPSHGDNSTCDMKNTTTTCTTVSNADNSWGDTDTRQRAAVDAHFGAATTFDYYKNVHGRNGIFGDGRGVPSRVHYGQSYDNAYWDGSRMTYGDGVNNSRPLVSLDVAGHEMSHGVTDNLVPGGLTYDGESGGLNEATSDIFGTAVEFYANNAADPGDYQIGEKININGNNTPLRYMYNPSLDGGSDSCWSTATKNKDVHYSSGVGNHFFFNLAEGTGDHGLGNSPVCAGRAGMTGIGRAKAEQIWYRALDVYFTSNTSYVNTANPSNTARAYTLRAAADLYGACSGEYKAVQAAWTAVNVTGNDATCTATGNDFSVTLSPASASLFRGSSTTIGVVTAVTAGSIQTVTLSATGLPADTRVTFNPGSVQAGHVALLSIATAITTPAGTYPITVSGTGSVGHVATFTLTVKDPSMGCPSPGQKLGNAGFEAGTTPWATTTGVIGTFGGQPARTGTRNAWLNGYGSAHTDTLSQSVTLPTGCEAYDFSFWLHVDSAESGTTTAHDTLRVQVLSPSGTVLGTLGTWSNLDKAPGYAVKSFSLAAYAGQTVTLKFAGTEDSSLQTSFVIDDTAVTVS